MTKNKKLLVWLLVGSLTLAVMLLLFFAPLEFIEKYWFVPFSLLMLTYIAYLKLSGGYKGISTVIAIVTVTFSVGATAWLLPRGLMSGGVFILLWWIVMPLVIWWDRQRP
jgi:hypothetical protein